MEQAIPDSTPAPARHEAAGHIHDDPAGRDAAITKMLLRPLPKLEPLPAPEPPKIDAVLTRAAYNLTHVDAALTGLGGGEEDIDEMPGYDALEEARDDALDTLSDTPAEGLPGLQAKARAILTRRVTENFEEGQNLGQSLARDLMRSPGWAIELHPDPIFAAIEEARRLDAARDAAAELPCPSGSPEAPEATAATAAFFAHIDNVLLKTAPATAGGCAALCRYALSYENAVELPLDEDQDGRVSLRILDLVARSPLLPYAPTNEVELKPGPTPDTEPRDWTAFAAMHPGMVPFPTAKPTFLAALDMAIPQEGQRLLDLANAEIERRRGAYLGHPDPDLWPRVEASLRRDLRVEALTAVASPERAEPAGDDRSQPGFDEAHAAWRAAVEANREPNARYMAHIAAARRRGGPTMDDILAAEGLPDVKTTSAAEDTAFDVAADMALDILRRPARSVTDLALQARAVIPHVWPMGTYEADAALAPDEDIDKGAVRLLIESCCAAAGVDWRGRPIGHAATVAVSVGDTPARSDLAAACVEQVERL